MNLIKLFVLVIFIVFAFLITGCATSVPVTVKFPDVPKELLVSCPNLKAVDPETKKLSEVLDTVVDNYAQYYDCKSNVDDWIEWYNSQKKIFDKVK
jgi:hypothetical protein